MLKYIIEYLVEYSSKSCLIYYDRITNLIVFSNYSIVSGNHYHHTYVLIISVASIVTWCPRASATFSNISIPTRYIY